MKIKCLFHPLPPAPPWLDGVISRDCASPAHFAECCTYHIYRCTRLFPSLLPLWLAQFYLFLNIWSLFTFPFLFSFEHQIQNGGCLFLFEICNWRQISSGFLPFLFSLFVSSLAWPIEWWKREMNVCNFFLIINFFIYVYSFFWPSSFCFFFYNHDHIQLDVFPCHFLPTCATSAPGRCVSLLLLSLQSYVAILYWPRPPPTTAITVPPLILPPLWIFFF